MLRGAGAALAVALVSAPCWPALAQAQAPARPGNTAVAFDIPAQPMAAALNAWAVQANAQVFVDPGPVAQLRAPAVKGTLTPRQALRALLAHSKLQVAQGTDGVFVIKMAPAMVITAPPPEAQQAAAPAPPAPPQPLTARAAAGPWLVGLAAGFAHDSTGAAGGASAAVSGEYFITDRLAAALSATTPRSHSFDAPAAPAAPTHASARLQSTALMLKYYGAPESRLDPFLGAGVDITTLSGASGVTGLDRVTVGPSVEAGVAVLLNAHWMINAGVSWARVRPEIGTGPGAQIHIDPVQFGLGFVYRFGASGNFLNRR